MRSGALEQHKEQQNSKRATGVKVRGLRRGEGRRGSHRWLTAVTRQILPSLLVWQLDLDNYSFCSGKHDNLHKRAAGRGQLLVPDS